MLSYTTLDKLAASARGSFSSRAARRAARAPCVLRSTPRAFVAAVGPAATAAAETAVAAVATAAAAAAASPAAAAAASTAAAAAASTAAAAAAATAAAAAASSAAAAAASTAAAAAASSTAAAAAASTAAAAAAIYSSGRRSYSSISRRCLCSSSRRRPSSSSRRRSCSSRNRRVYSIGRRRPCSPYSFDAEGRPVKFDTWLDDLHLFLQLTAKEDISLYDHALGHATAPDSSAASTLRSQWQTRDAHARFAIRNSLPLDEREHFGQCKTAKELYTAVVARYSSPASATLGRLSLPYLFPDLASFHTVADLITHLKTSEARFRAAMPAEFLASNPPPLWLTLYHIVTRLPDSLRTVRDSFLARSPTELTIALLEKDLLAAEASIVAVGASRGEPRTPFFEGCSPSPLLPSVATAAAVDLLGAEKVGAASASSGRRKSRGGKGGGGGGGGGGGDSGGGGGSGEASGGSGGGDSGGGGGGRGGGGSGGGGGRGRGRGGGGRGGGGGGGGGGRGDAGGGQSQQHAPTLQAAREWYAQRGYTCTYVIRTGDRTGQPCGRPHPTQRCFQRLTDAWRIQFPGSTELPRWPELEKKGVDIWALDFDAILTAMYAMSISGEGAQYLRVPPDPGIQASPAAALALHTFTLDSGASRSFFRDRTVLEPLARPVAVSLADPSGGPVIATSSTTLPCPAVPSGTLSGLYLPSFSTNLVAGCALQDGGVHQFTPAYERVTHCTCARTGRHLATFTREPGSDLYTLTTESPQVAASASASGQLSAPCSCRSLAHETVLWHHRLGHPSVQRLRAMHKRDLVAGLPRVLPPLPDSPAPDCIPCVEGRQRAAPHSSSFPPTTAPLQTLHMDVWGPACVRGQGQKRYFLIVVDDYSRYTTVFPLRAKGDVPGVLIPWISRARLQLGKRFHSDFPVLRLHSDRGGEFASDLLAAYCAEHGIEQSFTLPASPQQNGVAERRIGLVMEVARTSLTHAAAPHFLWPFAVRYAAHQLNLWPRVSLPETSPTLRWTGEVGDASRFRVWGSRAFVRDTSADKLSRRAVPCVFLGFVPDAPGWQFYHVTSRRVLASQDVTFDESVPFYRLFPYRTAPLPPPPLFLAPGAEVPDPLPPQGAAPSGVSQVDPGEPVEVAVDSRPASGGAEPGGAESGGAESGGAEPGGAEPGGAEPGGAEPGGAEPGGAEPGGAESGGAESGGAESSGAEPERTTPGGALSSQQLQERYLEYCRLRRGASGARPSTSPPTQELPPIQVIREWYTRRCSLRSGAPGAADPSGGAVAGAEDPDAGAAAGAEDPGVGAAAGAEDPTGGATAGAEDLTGGSAAGTEDPGVGAAAGAEDPGVGAAAGAEDSGVGATAGAEDPTGGAAAGAEDPGVGAAAGAEDSGVGAAAGVPAGSGDAARPRPYFVPLLQQVLGQAPPPSPPPSVECPLPVQPQSQLPPASPLPAPSPYIGPTGGLTERREPESRPASPVRTTRTGRRVPRERPPPVPGTHYMTLRPSTAPQRVPLPSPPASSLPTLPDPESDSRRAASPTVTRLLATVVTDPTFESSAASALVAELVDFAARCRLDYAASLVAESESESACPPSVGGECALGTDVLEDRQEEFQCFAAALPHLVSMLVAPEGDPDAPDIPTPRSYAEAMAGPYSSQWQTAMDAEMASWKSTGTYVDQVPPPGANIVSGMWIFRVKRPPGSPPVFKARYVARGFSQREGVDFFQTFSPTPKMTTLQVLLHIAAHRDYELHSLDFSTAFLQGSLHEEIWLRRPPGFTGSVPPGTQWRLQRPVYGLRQAPREWHDTLRTTLAALGFAPSTADPSLFLRTDTSLPPFYILVYVDDLVFATADTAALAHVKSELQRRHTCTDLGELTSYLGLRITRDRARRTITLTQSHMVQQVLQRFRFTYSSPQSTPLPTGHSLSALPSDESVEPSGPYPELVGCLMYLMTCTRPDLAYPLSILARYVAPGRHRKEHMDAAKRVLRYLCSTSGMGLVLGGRDRVVLTGHSDASWADDQATQRSSQGYTFSLGSGSVSWRSTRSSSVLSSSCEAEIYATAMAAQELCWLTYLLTDLGERPRSPPVLYVDNKAAIALCEEHRLEHRTKHIALRYFLARELQQRGQLRLRYVATEANTADVFTKALQPCDHQRFCTLLGLVPTGPHLLTS
ncbi:unnamed protein product [Closterium sp. Yama58-4]|nr:unnamed protein product [Closterium sp. Yama58-4]